MDLNSKTGVFPFPHCQWVFVIASHGKKEINSSILRSVMTGGGYKGHITVEQKKYWLPWQIRHYSEVRKLHFSLSANILQKCFSLTREKYKIQYTFHIFPILFLSYTRWDKDQNVELGMGRRRVKYLLSHGRSLGDLRPFIISQTILIHIVLKGKIGADRASWSLHRLLEGKQAIKKM